MGRLTATVAGWVGLVGVGLLLGFLRWGEPRVILDPVIILHREAIEAGEPPERPGPVTKIVYRYLKPDQVAIAPGGAAEAVARFCKPLVIVDTVEVERQVLIRSGVTRDGWWLQRGRVELVGLANTGDLMRFSFPTRPNWDFRASGDSILFRYPRFAAGRQALEFAVPPLAIYLLCRAVGC